VEKFMQNPVGLKQKKSTAYVSLTSKMVWLPFAFSD
jgi:hypothetical protein